MEYTNMQVYCATIDIVCLTFVFTLFVCTITRRRFRERSDVFFSLICLDAIGMLFGNIATWLFSGNSRPYNYEIAVTCMFIEYFSAVAFAAIYTNYLVHYLGIPEKVGAHIRRFDAIYIIVAELVVILNLKYGFFYTIDPVLNEYERGPFWIVSMLVNVPVIVLDIILLARYYRNVLPSAIVATVIYILLPITGAAFQAYYDGAPILYWLLSIGIFILFFNVRTEMLYQMEKQKKELAESKQAIMLSQIKPHFMYNSLTTIAALCDKNPAEAKRATLDFSRYLRGNIDSVNKMIPVPFKNEMEHINTYLSLEKLRFESRLNVVFDIETTDFSVPALTIQPLVENAVKHGICASADGTGTLTLKTWEEEKCFKISVSDDGAGFDVNKKPDDGREHIGLDNVRKRLLSMSNATMKIESEIGKGTTITVTVPKETRKSF
ncbi:MAG: histidine kinase [Lachnospiraceae bacterium]|nr:histidine kinase [Lachnospiraceae bacterium]